MASATQLAAPGPVPLHVPLAPLAVWHAVPAGAVRLSQLFRVQRRVAHSSGGHVEASVPTQPKQLPFSHTLVPGHAVVGCSTALLHTRRDLVPTQTPAPVHASGLRQAAAPVPVPLHVPAAPVDVRQAVPALAASGMHSADAP